MDKIICVGKNYLKHAQELGDAVPGEPLYFLKPPSASLIIRRDGMTVYLPPDRGEVHHELELVLKIAERQGAYTFSHYTFGLDLTLRELQSRLKEKGQPWEKAKVFKNSAIFGDWQELPELDELMAFPFALHVNGQPRQQGLGKDMRWSPMELLLDVQNWFPLCDGDVLFTGTPEGVGPLRANDSVEVNGGRVQYSFTCV